MAQETIQIQAAGDGAQRKLRVVGLAYSGGKIKLPGWRFPVVVDLAGMEIPESVPLLTNHENRTGSRVGVVRGRVDANALHVDGEILSTSGQANGVVEQAKAGGDWQLSIGADVVQAELVKGSRNVNGQQQSGPFYHVRKSVLREVSVVAVGADAATRMKVAATFTLYGGDAMEFEKWLESHEIDAAKLNAEQTALLKAAWEKGEEPPDDIAGAAVPSPAPVKPTGGKEKTAKAVAKGQEAEHEAAQTTIAARAVSTAEGAPAGATAKAEAEGAIKAERERVAAIQDICGGEYPKFERDAIRLGWSLEETSQKVLKAMREGRPQVQAHLSTTRERSRTCDADMLEAACVLTAKLASPEEHYDEELLERAGRRFRGGIGLQELILEAAWANGYPERSFRESREALRYAFGDRLQAGFSTVDIGGILSNVANKFLLEGFFSVERTWRNICAVRNVSDFKTVTSYRLIGRDQYEQVAPGGELKHGTLGNETYTNKADTYGLTLNIDRRDIINDDLGAITLVPRKLGRGSGLKINDVFWTTFMNNAAFFKAENGNYLSGADTVLGIDGLTKAEMTFMDQVDSDDKPIGVMPAVLLVPTALNALATQLNKSLELRDTTASTKYPVSNPHQGKFRAEVSRYLSNAKYAGRSQKAWYLLADPNDLAVIEVAFLNGQESPTIETAEADFNVLGIRMRGYHDFGVSLQDPRGGLKSKGEA
jgi:phage head maturation protease